MEEKNNENEVVDKVKDTAKGAAKKGVGYLIKKIPLKYILIVIGIIALAILAVGVINAIPFVVQSFFTSIISSTNPTAENATVADNAKSLVCINENGGYDLSIENFSQQILDELEKNKVDNEAAGFITENFEDMIDKYIKAEVQTMYPKTNRTGAFDGLIKIERASAETGKVEELEYVSYEQFKANPSLSKFSINPETFDLCIARKDTKEYKNYEDKIISDMTKVTMSIDEIEYQTSIQGYAMPFNFFLSLHMIAQDEKFMNDLLDEILKKDDPIVLTYVESSSKKTNQIDYEGNATITEYTEYYYKSTYDVLTGETITTEPTEQKTNYYSEDIDNSNVKDYMEPDYSYWKEIITTNTGTLYVTKADTLFQSVEKDIGEVSSSPEIVSGKDSRVVMDDDAPIIKETIDVATDNSYNLGPGSPYSSIKKRIEKDVKEIAEIITTTEQSKMYTLANEEMKINVDEFVEFINQEKYSKVKNNLTTAPSNLFYMLQQSETTQVHEKVMRYVIFKLNGVDYGVTEDDLFAILWSANNTVGGDYIVHTEKGPDLLKITDINTLKKAFSGYSRSEKLIQHAQAYLDLQEKYKVNAIFAAAVSISETGAGRAGHAVDGKNNWYNIECRCGNSSHGRFETYANADESIEKFFWLIAEGSYYFKKGNYTVSDIGMIYCENADAPGGWIENTTAFMTQMYRAAGIDTSSIFYNGSGGAVGKIADLIEWAESYVGKSQYRHWAGGYKSSSGTCAAFVKSAYHYTGLGELTGSYGTQLAPIGEKGNIVKKNGKVDCSQIPVGAFLVVPPGADGAHGSYGHTALYVGDGYVIEAGASTVQKNKINVDAFSDAGYSYWAIPKQMKKYMNSAEYKALISAQVTSKKGKGYTSQVKVNGRTYNEYKQFSPDYYGVKYWSGTMKSSGCGPTAIGIIASGYGIKEDPISIANYMDAKFGKTSPENVVSTIRNKLKLKCTKYKGTSNGTSDSEMTQIIKNQLKSGRPLIIDATPGTYTDNGHYMTLLAINEKNEVYLSNPGSSYKNGWVKIKTLLDGNGCGKCVITIDS